jgi:hypothetical protein
MTRLLQSGAVVSVLIDRTAETYRAITGSGPGGTRWVTSMNMPGLQAAPS